MTAPPLPPLSLQAHDLASTEDPLARMVVDFMPPGDRCRVFVAGLRSGTRPICDTAENRRARVTRQPINTRHTRSPLRFILEPR